MDRAYVTLPPDVTRNPDRRRKLKTGGTAKASRREALLEFRCGM